jgi:hypothetical protein
VPRTTKQISQRYSGNLTYYLKRHYFRALRFRVVAAIGLISLLFMALYGWWAWRSNNDVAFYSPGPISQAHASFGKDCAQCHDPKAPQEERTISLSAMDLACEKCHVQKTLHQPDVARGHACVQCHQEHVTRGPMLAVDSVNCTSCHGDAATMHASSLLGRGMPRDAFHVASADGKVYFLPPRPPDGYTEVIAAFDRGHPAFQIQRDHLVDPDTLKFNHMRHFQADIPATAQGKLTCQSCHQPDSTGQYMQRISFERNCQECHSLQFDRRNPDLAVPHGDPDKVRAFLRTLPFQYQQLAEKRGLRGEDEVSAFVRTQLAALRAETDGGEALERQVFFSDHDGGPSLHVGKQKDATTRASLTGCAYCHQVKEAPDAAGTPLVTAPVMPDRWFSRARFDHSKHTTISCQQCHAAERSTQTADILMPAQNNCLQCHSAKGGVVQTCTTCHTYHAPGNSAGATTVAGNVLLRQMLLGAGAVSSAEK